MSEYRGSYTPRFRADDPGATPPTPEGIAAALLALDVGGVAAEFHLVIEDVRLDAPGDALDVDLLRIRTLAHETVHVHGIHGYASGFGPPLTAGAAARLICGNLMFAQPEPIGPQD